MIGGATEFRDAQAKSAEGASIAVGSGGILPREMF